MPRDFRYELLWTNTQVLLLPEIPHLLVVG